MCCLEHDIAELKGMSGLWNLDLPILVGSHQHLRGQTVRDEMECVGDGEDSRGVVPSADKIYLV